MGGLMGPGAEKEVEDVNKKHMAKKKAKYPEQQKGYSKQDTTTTENLSFVAKVESPPLLERTVAVTDNTVAADLQDLDDKIKSMMMFSENMTPKHGKARICKVCGKEGQMINIRDHIEANHITGVSHTCNICGKSSRSRGGLRVHVARYHTSKANL